MVKRLRLERERTRARGEWGWGPATGERRARALMVLGTASHVGKSLVVTALGRILSNRGYRVAPFKAQNMALNSAATLDGGEIGRAQALQAEACRVTATVEMNPILIKPTSDSGAQVVVRGKVCGQVSAWDYHQRRVEELFPIVVSCFQSLAACNDVVVIEGAGSPAEINLKAHDIVNMRMADAADASCLLVGDIDRGGVFASLLGTMALLERSERRRIRGFAINKFRGDESLLAPGVRMIERRIHRPCLGVIPYVHGLRLDEEDSVALEDRRTPERAFRSIRQRRDDDPARPLRVGVVALPHMANFTDFDPFAHEPSVELAFLERPDDLAETDVAIVPGTKTTLDDLGWLRASGCAQALVEHSREGKPIVGICGGLQMLGREVSDPLSVESGGAADGLSLLDVDTELAATKTTIPASATWSDLNLFGQPVGPARARGYEIHMGETRRTGETNAFCQLWRAGSSTPVADGAVSANSLVVGTYLHGLFDSDPFRHAFIRAARAAARLTPPAELVPVARQRDDRLNEFAAQVEAALDVDAVLGWLE